MSSGTEANRGQGLSDEVTAGLRVEEAAPAASPLVSIIVPAYRASAFIEVAIRSALAQSFTDYEIVVVDDGSPDRAELRRVITPFRDRLQYIEQDNRGPAAARNTGIARARGRFLAFLDADDAWEPRFLEEQLAFLSRHPETDLVYADALLVGTSPYAGGTYMQFFPSRGEVTLEGLLAKRCQVITSGVVVLADRVREAGLFDESPEVSSAEDLDLWLRLLRRGARLRYQRKVLVRRRDHECNLSGNPVRMPAAALAVLRKLATAEDLTPRQRAVLERASRRTRAELELARGKQSFAQGDFAEARAAIDRANSLHHSPRLSLVLLGLRWMPTVLLRAYEWRGRGARPRLDGTGGGR